MSLLPQSSRRCRMHMLIRLRRKYNRNPSNICRNRRTSQRHLAPCSCPSGYSNCQCCRHPATCRPTFSTLQACNRTRLSKCRRMSLHPDHPCTKTKCRTWTPRQWASLQHLTSPSCRIVTVSLLLNTNQGGCWPVCIHRRTNQHRQVGTVLCGLDQESATCKPASSYNRGRARSRGSKFRRKSHHHEHLCTGTRRCRNR